MLTVPPLPAQEPLLLDSVSHIDARAHARVVVSGSHGGVSAAQFVLQAGCRPRLVLLNDAGVGKDAAGVAALALLDAHDLPCACYAHTSARIGEAADALANGLIAHVNRAAHAMGLRVGQRVRDWARPGPATWALGESPARHSD